MQYAYSGDATGMLRHRRSLKHQNTRAQHNRTPPLPFMIPTRSSLLSYPSPLPTQKRRKSLSLSQARKRKNATTFSQDDSQDETDLHKRTSYHSNDDSAFVKSPKILHRNIQKTMDQGADHNLADELNQSSPPSTPRKDIQINTPGSGSTTTPRPVETLARGVLVSSPILIPDSDDDMKVAEEQEEEEEEEDVPLIRKRHGRPLPGNLSASAESWRNNQNDGRSHGREPRSCYEDGEDADTEFDSNSRMYDEVFLPSSLTKSPRGNGLRRAKNPAVAHRTSTMESEVLASDSQESVGIENDYNVKISDDQEALQGDRTVPDEPSAITSTYTALGTCVSTDTDEDEVGFMIDDLSEWLEEGTTFRPAPAPSGSSSIARGSMTVLSPVSRVTKGKIYADGENIVLDTVLLRRPTAAGKNLTSAHGNGTSTLTSTAREKPRPPFVVSAPDDVHTPFDLPRSPKIIASTMKNIKPSKDSYLLGSSSSSLQDTPLRQVQAAGLKWSLGAELKGRRDIFADRDKKDERRDGGFKRSQTKEEETIHSSPEFVFESLLSNIPKHHTSASSRQRISQSDQTSSIQPTEVTTLCPICSCRFSEQEILIHASDCMGPDLGGPDQAEIEDNPGNSSSSSSFLPSPSRTQRRSLRTTNQNRARPADSFLSRRPELWDEIEDFSDDSQGQVQEKTFGSARKRRNRIGLEKQAGRARLRRESPGHLLSSEEEDEGTSSRTECPVCRQMISVADIEVHVEEELVAMEKDRKLSRGSSRGVDKGMGKAQVVAEPVSVVGEERERKVLGFTKKDDIPMSPILTFSSPRGGTAGKRGRGGDFQVMDEFLPRDQASAGTIHRSEDEDEDDRWIDVNDMYEENTDASGDGQQVDEDDGYMSPLEGIVNLNDHRNNPGSEFAKYFEQFGPRQGPLDDNASIISAPASAQSHQRQSHPATISAATPAPTKSRRRRRTPGVPDFEVEGWQHQEQNLKYAGGGSARKKKGDSEVGQEKWRKVWKNGKFVFQINKAWMARQKEEDGNDGNDGKRIRKEKAKERGKGKASMSREKAKTAARNRSQPATNNYYGDGDLDDGVNTGGGGFGETVGGLAWEGLGVAEYGSGW